MFEDRRQNRDRRVKLHRRMKKIPATEERRAGEERRQIVDRRRRTLLSAKVIYNNHQSVLSCTCRDLSEQGAKLIFGVVPTCPNTFELVFGDGHIHRCEVAYRDGTTIGVHFLDVAPTPNATAPEDT